MNDMLYSNLKRKHLPCGLESLKNTHTVDSMLIQSVYLLFCFFVCFNYKGIPGIRGNSGLPGPPGVEVKTFLHNLPFH